MARHNPLSAFPFESKLSLAKLIDYWKNLEQSSNEYEGAIASQVIKAVDEFPELNSPIPNSQELEKYEEVIDMLMKVVIPPTLSDTLVSAAFAPFSFDRFFSTKPYEDLLALHGGSVVDIAKDIPVEEIVLQKTVGAYMQILETFYGVTIPLEKPIVLKATHPKTGLINYFKVELNPKFCEAVAVGELPELSDDDIKQLVNNLYDIDVWKSKLPTSLFEFHGFSVYSFVDVSTQEILSSIKESLLNRDTITDASSFDSLQSKFRSLLQLSDLKIGISGYQKSQGIFVNYGQNIKKNIQLDKSDGIACSVGQKQIHDKFVQSPIPVVVEDLEHSNVMMGMEQHLLEQGIHNIIVAPLFYEGEFIGLFQLGSPNKGDLNALTLTKIADVLPLLSVSLKRGREEMENRVQSVIKEQYTSIHPTVEWKFVNSAYKMINQEDMGEKPVPDEIVFKNVFPLYAASDIRNSSVERNKAIRKDLKEQLKLAKDALKQVLKDKNFPILEELQYRIGKMSSKINKALMSGDETTIISFLHRDVEPIFKTIEKEDPSSKQYFKAYWSALDEELGILYNARKQFEASLMKINDTVSVYLDEQQKVAQDMFPHYFEKYKTDGVEYNIYIGESMTNKKPFDSIYIRNLKLWQLITTAEIAKMVHNLKPDLSLPLDATHLILVHSSPLSVQFRMDEKQFDVDGAYNMRYEIVKKRIDKALIKGTTERLTQPGKIAIVYSQDEDASEYLAYIDYMHSKGYVTDQVEMLEIEELQGVSGLRAIRVPVDLTKNPVIDELEKMDLLETVEKKSN